MSLPPPSPGLRACVVVPARDEEARVGACVAALAAQTGVARDAYEVLLVLDGCTDATGAVAERAAATASMGGRWLTIHLLDGPRAGVGAARGLGMRVAAARLRAAGAGPRALIASTDADSVAVGGWLAALHAATAGPDGAVAVGGRIELDPGEAAELPSGVLERRAQEAALRLARVREHTPGAEHHQCSGASLGITLAAYDAVGGLPDVPALEDEALERALIAAGLPLAYVAAARVITSARTESHVPRGLAQVLRTATWAAGQPAAASSPGRSTPASRVSEKTPGRPPAPDTPGDGAAPPLPGASGKTPDRLRASDTPGDVDAPPRPSVSAETPGEPTAASPGGAGGTGPLGRGSAGTPAGWVVGGGVLTVAAGRGARGRAVGRARRGAGDGVEVVVVLGGGATAEDAAPLVAALRADPALALVRGVPPGPAPALAELVARPLLNLHAPDLAAVADPLSPTWAIRADVLARLALPASDAVDLTVLVDVWRGHGLRAIAELPVAAARAPDPPPTGEAAYELLVALHGRAGDDRVALSSAYATPDATSRALLDELPPLRP